MGSQSAYTATLHWIGGGGDAIAQPLASLAQKNKVLTSDDFSHVSWEQVPVVPYTK